uniref:Uncharacterized protein n=1 Tax=Setaria digitata TaxID=48799 RepID=A0A915Q3A5_9BILA
MIFLSILLLQILLDNEIIVSGNDIHARERRSNIPCGTSFTPCSRAALAFGLASNTISNDDDETKDQRNQSDAKGRFTDIAQLINHQKIITAIRDAKDEIDMLFNHTEPEIFKNINGTILKKEK